MGTQQRWVLAHALAPDLLGLSPLADHANMIDVLFGTGEYLPHRIADDISVLTLLVGWIRQSQDRVNNPIDVGLIGLREFVIATHQAALSTATTPKSERAATHRSLSIVFMTLRIAML